MIRKNNIIIQLVSKCFGLVLTLSENKIDIHVIMIFLYISIKIFRIFQLDGELIPVY